MRVRAAGETIVNATSNVNFFAGDVVPNLASASSAPTDGSPSTGGPTAVHVLGDVYGYFGAGGSSIHTIAPNRMLDTGSGARVATGRPGGPDDHRRLVVAGQGGSHATPRRWCST
jgi:hypothetical protein